MRFGYFLAGKKNEKGQLGVRDGDPELSQIAQGLWFHYGTSAHGYHNTGASVWITDEEMIVSMTYPDLFSEKPQCKVIRKAKKLQSHERITKDYKYTCKKCGVIHTANLKDSSGVVRFPPTLTTSQDKDGKWFAHCKDCELF